MVDEFLTSFLAPLDAEDDHGPAFAPEVFEVFGVLRVVGQPGVADPGDAGVALQMFRHAEGVFTVPVHAEGQGFDALHELPGIVRSQTGPEVPQGHGAHAQDKGEGEERGREIMPPTESVVGVVRLIVERVLAASPVEFSAIHYNAPEAGAVAAEPFGEGVDDDIGPVIEWPG